MLHSCELLSMVRKHSKLIKQIAAEDQEATDVEKDLGFWKDVMDLYFVRGKDSRKRQDLLFFVRKKVFIFLKFQL